MPAGSAPSYSAFPYHVIALSESPLNYWGIVIWTPPPAGWEPLGIPTEAQLGMVQCLLANPHLICDLCSDCHQSYSHPYKLRWNLPRGPQWPWGTPACPSNGSWPAEWSPDTWPPAWDF
jgi:hypothetical protein